MGHESIVYGYIMESDGHHEENKVAIAQFSFDELYPFSNIFWCDSSARYWHSVIGFTGSCKQIEPDWNEWMWKFSQLLSTLEASQAVVNLDGYMGSFAWKFRPLSVQRRLSAPRPTAPLSPFLKDEQWVIYETPDLDFSLDLALCDTDERWQVPRW